MTAILIKGSNTEKLNTLTKIADDSGLDIKVYQDEDAPDYYGITCNGDPYYWNISYCRAREVLSALICGHKLHVGKAMVDNRKYSDIFPNEDD